MSLTLSVPNQPTDLKPRIVVFGVGGAGGNAVNNMIRSNLEGVECVVANTDAQALAQSQAERRIQLGRNITQGLGAGSRPDIGRAAAEEEIDEILEELVGVHMVFIAAGMGGGTGTGSSPVLARAARDQGILTVGVVTKPFHFEGPHRMRVAEDGLEELQQFVDTLIVIPNQNLFRVATEKTTFADAFKMADHVLYSGVRGVTDLMVMPGLINLDFADIRTVMSEMGKAMMGAGEANGEERARAAAEQAINNPLLDDVSMKGARGVLINITGGMDMTLYEVDESVNRIRDEVDPNANLIFGSTFDETLDGQIRVSIFATGIDADALALDPTSHASPIRLVAEGGSLSAATARQAEAAPVGAGSPIAELASESPPPADLPLNPTGEPAQGIAEGASRSEPSLAPAHGSLARETQPEPAMPAPETTRPAPEPNELHDALQELAGRPIGLDAGAAKPAPDPELAKADAAPAWQASEGRTFQATEIAESDLGAQREEAGKDRVAPFPRVDATDRIPQSEEEDLLEIPAFLRRQAN
ncbi:MAG: cell division protein FtsZ [Alphaproteobacteria bacterium]|nr:cell division protein FtsZ [Alphaproteobacteria bacterium]